MIRKLCIVHCELCTYIDCAFCIVHCALRHAPNTKKPPPGGKNRMSDPFRFLTPSAFTLHLQSEHRKARIDCSDEKPHLVGIGKQFISESSRDLQLDAPARRSAIADILRIQTFQSRF